MQRYCKSEQCDSIFLYFQNENSLVRTFLLFFIVISTHSFAQKENYLSFELGGSGGIASINFEHELKDFNRSKLFLRTGFSAAPIDVNNGSALIFPVMTHWSLFDADHHLDLGLGLAFTVSTRLQFYTRMPASIGYRYEPADKRYYLRAAYTPIISYLFEFQLNNWAGLTFGYRLKS